MVAEESPPPIVNLSPTLYPVPPKRSKESLVMPLALVRLKLSAFAVNVAPLPVPVSTTRDVGTLVNPYPPLTSSQPGLPSGQFTIGPPASTQILTFENEVL